MPAFHLHMKVQRVEPPRPDGDGQDTLAADAMVVLSLHLNSSRIQRMEVHGYDGRAPRDDDAAMPAILQPETVFRAWLGMGRCIASSDLYPDSVRSFCEAVSGAAHEIAERLTAEHDLATRAIEHIPGAPTWVHRAGDTIGVEMVDAWSEALGVDPARAHRGAAARLAARVAGVPPRLPDARRRGDGEAARGRTAADLTRAREPHRRHRARHDPPRSRAQEAPDDRGHAVNAPTSSRLDPDALLAMWLRDRIAELRRDAARARRAYSRGRMAEIAERLAACHDQAASAYETELLAITAPVARPEGG